jgi:conjugal transfer pilus assembly protein TraI
MSTAGETVKGAGFFTRLVRPVFTNRGTDITGLLPVLPTERLLTQHDRPVLLRRINHLLSVPQPHFESLYHVAILRYARFVQQLPASEAHHHAGPGGMLDHGLEVLASALALRRGYLLPQGAESERVAREQDLWTYAVFTAALLHDIGKPAVDQRVRLFDRRQRPLGIWDPWRGPMDQRVVWYEVEFLRDRVHGLHERVATLLAHFIVPEAGLSWLTSDREVLAAWVAAVSGDSDHAGVLGEIIARADGESVARNLGAGEWVQFSTARAKPLHEKLLTALRHLLAEGELPLNRDGAGGWLVGDELWLVSKRATDALRAHLIREGHEGVPSRNDRIFDVLQEHGLAVANGERAIWLCRIAGDGWAHELTLLRVPASRVWPDPDRRPDAFKGTVTPIERGQAADAEGRQTAPSEVRRAQRPKLIEQPSAPGAQTKHAATETEQTTVPETTHVAKVSGPSDTSDAGEQFLAWLRDTLTTGRIQVNTVNARIHVVPEGILLVSPAIFKDFDHENWQQVQKRFTKLRIHRRHADGTNIHTYKVIGHRKQSRIKGYLLPDPQGALPGIDLPEANRYLSPLDDSSMSVEA